MLKKIICIVILLVMMFSLVACNAEIRDLKKENKELNNRVAELEKEIEVMADGKGITASIANLIKLDYLQDLQNRGYCEDKDTIDDVNFVRYYGVFNGGVALMITAKGMAYADKMVYANIDGVLFTYSNSNSILIWKNREFIKLRDAYEQGLLTKEDLIVISELHNK